MRIMFGLFGVKQAIFGRLTLFKPSKYKAMGQLFEKYRKP